MPTNHLLKMPLSFILLNVGLFLLLLLSYAYKTVLVFDSVKSIVFGPPKRKGGFKYKSRKLLLRMGGDREMEGNVCLYKKRRL